MPARCNHVAFSAASESRVLKLHYNSLALRLHSFREYGVGGDDRTATWQVRLTNEALLGIRVLKYALAPGGPAAPVAIPIATRLAHPARGGRYNCWEQPTLDRIEAVRAREIDRIRFQEWVNAGECPANDISIPLWSQLLLVSAAVFILLSAAVRMWPCCVYFASSRWEALLQFADSCCALLHRIRALICRAVICHSSPCCALCVPCAVLSLPCVCRLLCCTVRS